MVVVGTDAHKYSHTFVATDEVGRQLGEKTVKAQPSCGPVNSSASS